MNQFFKNNIESFLIDAFIILSFFLFKDITLPTSIFLVLSILLLFVILLVNISKSQTKKALYFFSVITAIFLWLKGSIDILLGLTKEIDRDIASVSLQSIIILIITISVTVIIIVTKKTKKKPYKFTRTVILPILFSILITSLFHVSIRYPDPVGILFYIYIPMRFLMINKEKFKWYQFILMFAALFSAFKTISTNNNYPTYPVSQNLNYAFPFSFACREYEDFQKDKVIEVITDYSPKKIKTGKWYFVVTDIWNETWRVDKFKTIAHYTNNKSYSSDSSDLHKIFSLLKPYGKISKKHGTANQLCNNAKQKIENKKYKEALEELYSAQSIYSKSDRIYFLKSIIFIEQNQDSDSICNNLSEAIKFFNTDAIKLYREYCIPGY